jgi:hypothetical protein
MGGYFWAKTIRDEFHLRSGAVSGTADGRPADGRPGGALLWEAAAGKDLAGEDLAVEAAGEGGRPAMAGQVPGGAAGPGDRAADDRAAHLARLSQEVRGHGRWHGLR